jgi:hypothetical protein
MPVVGRKLFGQRTRAPPNHNHPSLAGICTLDLLRRDTLVHDWEHMLQSLPHAFVGLQPARDRTKALVALHLCARHVGSQPIHCLRSFGKARREICHHSGDLNGKKTALSAVKLARRSRFVLGAHDHLVVLNLEKNGSHTFHAEKDCDDQAPPQQRSKSCDYCLPGFCKSPDR